MFFILLQKPVALTVRGRGGGGSEERKSHTNTHKEQEIGNTIHTGQEILIMTRMKGCGLQGILLAIQL